MSSSLVASSCGLPEDGTLAVITEHPRHKRRRRGKKRKFNKSDKDKSANEGDVSENNAAYDMSDADENEALEKDVNRHFNDMRNLKGILIRPIDVPKAPENSTQFIMEDHTMDDHKESHLYFSFETPDPYNSKEMCEEDATSQDINFMYESIQNLDDSFCTRDFEAAYTTSRYDYYMQLPKQELIVMLENVHHGQKQMEEDLLTYDPCSVLEQLQHKLLSLQEENVTLKKTNSNLKSVCRIESNESASEQSLEELSGNEDVVYSSELKEPMYIGSVESDSDPSVDGHFPQDKDNCEDLEETQPSNMDSIDLEQVSERLLEHASCGNEK